MDERLTLRQLFENHKEDIQEKLRQYHLPEDIESVQKFISDYLDKILATDGEYRQNLTMAEGYILQAGLSLMSAQLNISAALDGHRFPTTEEKPSLLDKNLSPVPALVGTTGGALAGKIFLGGWGAVVGAIVGTIVSIYLTGFGKKKDTTNNYLDTDIVMSILKDIIDSLDNLVETFRAQINRVVDSYENQPRPTFENTYGSLIEEIQSLVGYRRSNNTDCNGLCKRIDNLVKAVGSYGLKIIDYSGENRDWFDLIPIEDIQTDEQIYPAIVKDNHSIVHGRVFIPQESKLK